MKTLFRSVGYSPYMDQPPKAADVNGDGRINDRDVLLLFRQAAAAETANHIESSIKRS